LASLIGAFYLIFWELAGPFELQVMKLEKKIKAGAQFIQTQPVYDVKIAEEVNSLISELGAVPIIGLLPIKSLRMANFMKKLNPTSIPNSLIERLEKAENPAKYGWDYIIDLAHAIAEFGKGIHFMLVGKTEELASFIDYLRNHKRYNHKF
jgi:methylenetetrahydrofolate reductase (NADPH)